MRRVDEFVFYEAASHLHTLCEMEVKEVQYHEVFWTLSTARSALNDIYTQRPFSFTRDAALSLYNAISAVIPVDFEQMLERLSERDGSGPVIEPWRVNQIRSSAIELETVLRNECRIMDTYHIDQKGVYSTKDLIETAHFHVPLPARDTLAEITKLDLDQAGRCLAFDLPTAAAFHLLQATESVIRKYYRLLVPSNKQAAPKMRNWGVYIKVLKKHDAKAAILSILDHLRDVYRNPVLYPEESYTDDRVIVLFGLCVSAITLVEAECAALTQTSLPLQLG